MGVGGQPHAPAALPPESNNNNNNNNNNDNKISTQATY